MLIDWKIKVPRAKNCWIRILAHDILKYFFLFSPENWLVLSFKLSPKESVCVKCQNLFAEKNSLLVVC